LVKQGKAGKDAMAVWDGSDREVAYEFVDSFRELSVSDGQQSRCPCGAFTAVLERYSWAGIQPGAFAAYTGCKGGGADTCG
jgi:hypothetical protein